MCVLLFIAFMYRFLHTEMVASSSIVQLLGSLDWAEGYGFTHRVCGQLFEQRLDMESQAPEEALYIM